MQNTTKRLLMWAATIALILLIPLVAMQFAEEMQWTLFDFVFMGTLLFGAGLAYELVARKMNNGTYRAAAGSAVVAAVLLVWINGAVGIIGDGPVNLLYGTVFAVGLIGALMARFRPHGMCRTLLAIAIAQFLVPVIALIISDPNSWGQPGVLGVFVLNSFFVALWIGSALLFRRAS